MVTASGGIAPTALIGPRTETKFGAGQAAAGVKSRTELGSRLTAGHGPLKPSIMVRFHSPQLCAGEP